MVSSIRAAILGGPPSLLHQAAQGSAKQLHPVLMVASSSSRTPKELVVGRGGGERSRTFSPICHSVPLPGEPSGRPVAVKKLVAPSKPSSLVLTPSMITRVSSTNAPMIRVGDVGDRHLYLLTCERGDVPHLVRWGPPAPRAPGVRVRPRVHGAPVNPPSHWLRRGAKAQSAGGSPTRAFPCPPPCPCAGPFRPGSRG